MSGGDTYDVLLDALNDSTRPDGIFLHCGDTVAITAGMPLLSSRFDGLIGAYGNVGYNSGAFLDEAGRGNWFSTHGETPYSFSQTALGWTVWWPLSCYV